MNVMYKWVRGGLIEDLKKNILLTFNNTQGTIIFMMNIKLYIVIENAYIITDLFLKRTQRIHAFQRTHIFHRIGFK